MLMIDQPFIIHKLFFYLFSFKLFLFVIQVLVKQTHRCTSINFLFHQYLLL